MTKTTRRLINREASAVARLHAVTPTLLFLACVRVNLLEFAVETDTLLGELTPEALRFEAAMSAYCIADCYQPRPTCRAGAKCDGCKCAMADGVVKGY